jgi:hypothetical protein
MLASHIDCDVLHVDRILPALSRQAGAHVVRTVVHEKIKPTLSRALEAVHACYVNKLPVSSHMYVIIVHSRVFLREQGKYPNHLYCARQHFLTSCSVEMNVEMMYEYNMQACASLSRLLACPVFCVGAATAEVYLCQNRKSQLDLTLLFTSK